MTKEEITIPRWLLERIEDTLRIQYNINLDKKTGETCQDRNIKESLNGVRKLLKGEELTGGERLERLQPSLASNLDEAAIVYINTPRIKSGKDKVFNEISRNHEYIAFKAGAKWREQQNPKLPDNLDEAAEKYEHNLGYYECMNQWPSVAFKAGAEWMANEFENNRLRDCEALSEEDYKLESDFVDAHIKKNHRLPTFLDAIKYGAKWMAWQGETFNGFMSVSGKRSIIAIEGSSQNFKFGENVIVQIRKKQ